MIKIKDILLVAQNSGPVDELKLSLSAIGVENIHSLSIDQDILTHVSKIIPDAVIIEVDTLDHALLDQIKAINQSHSIPVLLFTETDEDLIIEKAIKSGVATYIVGSLEARRLASILQVAITRFKDVQQIKNDLVKTRAQLEERKVIDKAKGLLMKHKQYSEDDAYQALRKMAMDKNKRIIDIAEGIITAFDLLA